MLYAKLSIIKLWPTIKISRGRPFLLSLLRVKIFRAKSAPKVLEGPFGRTDFTVLTQSAQFFAMARDIERLRSLANAVLQDIDATPIYQDVGVQTDSIEEPTESLKSVLRKRKGEFLSIIDDLLDIGLARQAKVRIQDERRYEESIQPADDDAETISSRESSIHSVTGQQDTPRSNGTCAQTVTTATTAYRNDAETIAEIRRNKIMEEVAIFQGVKFKDIAELNVLYHGQTFEELLQMLPEHSPADPKLNLGVRVDLIDLMDVPKLDYDTVKKLSRAGKQKYVAAVVLRMKQLIKQYGEPASLRKIGHSYNIDYNTFYDTYKQRRDNPYLTDPYRED